MNNHEESAKNDTKDEPLAQFIALVIQNGTFSPTAHARQNTHRTNTHQANTHQANIHRTEASPLPAARPSAPPGFDTSQPAALNHVGRLACDYAKILNQTPLETHQYFHNQGYHCVTSVSAGHPPHALNLKETCSWDQQLILSIWHCLEVSEDSSESPLQRLKTPSALQYLHLEQLKKTAQLSPQKRLEHFSKNVIFSRLKDAPIAIFIDSLKLFKNRPYALETLFTWIWQCYQQLEQQNDYHPLRFVVLGKMVI